MEFGDDRKIFNHYNGEVFRQFPKRGRQMKRAGKLVLRWNLRTFFQIELVWTEWTDGNRYESTLPDYEVI